MSGTRQFDAPDLKIEVFEALCLRRGWRTDAQRAHGLGISTAQLSKIINRHGRPGSRFIHATMTAFAELGVTYKDLYGDAGG